MHAIRSLSTVGSALALGLLLVAGEGSVAPTSTEAAWAACRVRNVTQGTRGHSLRNMVQRSHDRDRLLVRGSCPGQVVISTDITIIGKGVTPALTGRGRTRVVRVGGGATVVLKRLRIWRGRTSKWGAGIWNEGRLTLRGVIVRNNRADSHAGGIENGGSATLAIIDSTIRDNSGSGVWNKWAGQLTIGGSTVRGNRGDGWQHGGIVNRGYLTVSDSTISGNRGSGVRGGGTITDSTVSDNRGTGILRGGTLIRTTVSGNEGGGILVSAGCEANGCDNDQVALIDSEVTGNSPYGIYAYSHGVPPNQPKVTLEGSSSVHDNVPDDCVGTPAC